MLLSNRSQISCKVSETMATPRALLVKASKGYTCLKNVIFGNYRAEERSIRDWATIFGEGFCGLLDSV